MIRRFSAALIGLALTMPILAAAPVGAHGPVPFVVDFDEQADDDIVGTVTNHTTTRRGNVTVTATWDNGTDPDIVESEAVFISSLSPHNSSPFRLDPVADVTGLTLTSVTASGATNGTDPTGGLSVAPGSFLVADVYTGQITNDGAAAAQNVRVAAVRVDGTTITGAQESATIPTIAAGDTADYVITFEAGTLGDVQGLIAKTNAGPFYTSWNNYFGDLHNTAESFVDEIAFMADQGITTGCGSANFCPRQSVTRAQMAVFLDRALGLETETDPHPFTDISTQSPDFQQSIQNLWGSGITAGCGATTYCPNQSVTRGQMSKFIVVGYGLAPISGPGIFTDDNGHFSEQYNNRMDADGITSGCGTNLYCPNSPVLREQMAVFIFRAENPGP